MWRMLNVTIIVSYSIIHSIYMYMYIAESLHYTYLYMVYITIIVDP